MDNNNPQNPQPMPGPQPMGPQPMPGPQPMGPQPMPGQVPPYGQPMYQQPAPRPPKQPMDPKKKKAIITWCCIGGGVLVLGIAAAIILPIILRIDYSTAYNTVKDLNPEIQNLYNGYNCSYVVDDLESDYTSVKTYNEYIEECKGEMSRSDLVDQLGETDGVKRNDEIKNQFDKFKSAYDATVVNADDLASKLNIYAARHNFVVLASDLSYSSTDAEIQAAAKVLIDSGNDTLKTYGEGWQEKYLAAAKAYQDWYNSSEYFGEKYDNKKAKDTEYDDWVTANKPDIESLYPLNVDNTSKVHSEFSKLYDLISETYEMNYNQGSGDCTEFLGEVVCD